MTPWVRDYQMNSRLQHNVRGSTGGWEAPLGASWQSSQKRTIYLLQNRTFLFVVNTLRFPRQLTMDRSTS
jgi:hypothetical protein